MIRVVRLALVIMVLLMLSWSGRERRDVLGDRAHVVATPVPLDAHDPAPRQVGALTFLGGVELTSRDSAFGGFSSLSVVGDRVTLLSDGGNIVRFKMDGGFRIADPEFGDLPAGPGTGWNKSDRDSESMTLDPATGQVWVGFERYNQIWRYAPGLRLPAARAAPAAMADWEMNGGPESLVRLHDGRFLTISETHPGGSRGPRDLILFAGDPVASADRNTRYGYTPPAGYDVSDAAELPDGRVLVLNRRLSLPFRWSVALTVIDLRGVKPGAVVAGVEIARLAAPLTVDNFEGLAVTREGDATIVWMVSDDNQFWLQRSLLMKFRLDL